MWKTIILHNKPTNYSCSESGIVRNDRTNKILKGKVNQTTGYIEYQLYTDIDAKYYLAHRLVAQLFLDNINNYPVVNHKDGNKLNNHYSNLEWCSYQQNNQHAWDTKLNDAKTYSNIVLQYDLENNFIAEYPSCAEAERQTGAAKIKEVCYGERNTSGGYVWKFKYPHEKRNIGKKKKVGQYTLEGEFITEFESGSEASRQTGINRRGIGDCCNGKQKTAGGFLWKFV